MKFTKEQLRKRVETRLKNGRGRYHYKQSPEARAKRFKNLTHRFPSGENSPSWKGGVTYLKEYVNWQKNHRNRTLLRLRRESKSHSFQEWTDLKTRYQFTCPGCQQAEPEIRLTIDHIIPLSLGGTDEITNIQPLCIKCNQCKHAKIIKYEHRRGTTE